MKKFTLAHFSYLSTYRHISPLKRNFFFISKHFMCLIIKVSSIEIKLAYFIKGMCQGRSNL